jgi:mannose-6-phosphate isomerase-like protein (cupin superfamily)
MDAGTDMVNLDVMLTRFTEHWSPKKIADVNDYEVKLVKVSGEFTWHSHADTDELFLVLDGEPRCCWSPEAWSTPVTRAVN